MMWKFKIKTLLFTMLVYCTLLSSALCVNSVFASSPAFVRHEVKDSANDWWDLHQQKFTTRHNFPDIYAVSYSSDGRFLNSTLFLRSTFIKDPIGYAPAYGMLIDVDSDRNTGWQGQDYMMRIVWDHQTNTWTYELQEWSLAQKARLLEQKHNFTSFFDKGKNAYVHLSLDLNRISSPKQYIVVFFVDYDFLEGGVLHEISDYSNWVHIPPPQFLISTFPTDVSLRPGEEKSIEVRVNSTTPIAGSHVSLATNHIDGVQSTLVPKERDIPVRGIGTSDLHIKALDNATVNPHTLQIFGDVSFPSQYIGGESRLKIMNENVSLSSTLPLTVLHPPTFEEKFTTFWTVYGGVLSLIGGGFAAGFAALLFDKLRKYKVKEK